MNGIEKITHRIEAEAQHEIDNILSAARAEAETIAARYETAADKEGQDILARGRKAAEERVERLESVAALEARKLTLAAKQEMLGNAFDLALKQLTDLPEEEYVALLAKMAAKSALTGREEVILSPRDHARCGAQVVSAANAILAKQAAPKLPDELSDTKAGAFLSKVVTVGSALLNGTAMLTLSDEQRPILGGLVLSDGEVEINCTFDTLVRMQRESMAAEVAKVLFA